MKTAVLIPTLNEGKTIGQLLDSLNANTHKDNEIVIIDGGSTDETIELAKSRGATVLKEKGDKEERCPANARNQGAEHTDADILCFLDGDCSGVNDNFLGNAVRAFGIDVAAAYAGYRTLHNTVIGKIVSKREGISMHPTFVRKGVFSKVGGYPLIGFGEDRVFDARVRNHAENNSKKVIEIPESYWIGNAASSLRELYVQSRWYGRTIPLYLKALGKEKHLSDSLKAYFKSIYFLSFVSAVLIPLNWIFLFASIPFFLILAALVLKNSGWGRGKIITNLVSGMAMFNGLLSYVFTNKRKGR